MDTPLDQGWQALDEQERLLLQLEALQRVANGESTRDDADLLASELGISTYWKTENGHAQNR